MPISHDIIGIGIGSRKGKGARGAGAPPLFTVTP